VSEPASADDASQKRPWLAALLSIVIPGLGHLYIRMWGRALLWFGIYILTTVFLLPESLAPDEFSFDAFIRAGEAVPNTVSLTILLISVLCIIDAYRMATQQNEHMLSRHSDGVSTCPECRKEVDEDLDFCHWCTARLDDGSDAE